MAVAVLLAAGSLGGIAPQRAGAAPRDRLLVGIDQTVVFKGPALVGPNYTQGRGPGPCGGATRTSCDVIPVTLDIEMEKVQAEPENYLLYIETSWNPKAAPNVPSVGVVSDDQVNTYVYTDPPSKDDTGAVISEQDAFLAPSPTSISFPGPKSKNWNITVENMYGYNDGYTLKVSLYYLGGGPGADKSIDEGGTPVDLSDDSSVAVTPTFDEGSLKDPGSAVTFGDLSGSTFSDSGLTRRTITLSLADLRGDNDLDGLQGVDDAAVLRLQAAKNISNVSIGGPPRIRKVSSIALALWLVGIPLALAAGLVVMMYRRRTVIAGASS
jgi:hypothetical protein